MSVHLGLSDRLGGIPQTLILTRWSESAPLESGANEQVSRKLRELGIHEVAHPPRLAEREADIAPRLIRRLGART